MLARIPEAARPETMQGAEAYARYFFAQLNAGSIAGDPGPLEGLGTNDCDTCNSMIATLQVLKDAGEHQGVEPLEIIFASASGFTSTVRRVLVTLKQRSVPVLNRDGQVIRKTQAGSGSFVADLTFDDRWRIKSLEAIQ